MNRIASLVLIASCLAASASAVQIGASAGYLVDSEKAYLAARIGQTLMTTGSVAHSAELELGYADLSEGSIDASLMPITLNYRADFAGTDKFGAYVGLGLGTAETSLDAGGYYSADAGWSFAMQAFAGTTYKLSPAASLHAGARYIWIDKVSLFGLRDVEVGDDVAFELGLSFKF